MLLGNIFTHQYDQVSDTPASLSKPEEEDEESRFLEEKNYQNSSMTRRKISSAIIKQSVLISTWLTIVCIVLATIMTIILREKRDSTIDDMCFEHSTFYSPVAKDIDTTPRLVTTNGSLDWPSVYRQPPGQDVDDAWNKISYNMGVFSLPEEIALKAGLDRGDVRIPAGYEGSGEYMASLELTHQLHCVNFLRKAVWFNYPHYRNHGDEFQDPQHVLEMHLYHCLETVRQVIMCNADPGIVGYKYVRGREKRPYPDFNTPHKCRDWRGMIDWAYERSIPGHPEESDFVPGEGETVYDADP